jgi:hypothetical protein
MGIVTAVDEQAVTTRDVADHIGRAAASPGQFGCASGHCAAYALDMHRGSGRHALY